MQKNVASQQFVVFAFNATTNLPLTGDAANITATISKDFAADVATNDVNPTETQKGFYVFDATQAETNADSIQIFPSSITADIQVISVPGLISTTPVSFGDGIIQTGDNFARLAAYRLGELMSASLASQPFSTSLLGDLTQDDPDNAGTQQFSTPALNRVWDEILTGATHNINNSSGKRLRQVAAIIFNEGTAQSGGNNSIQLAAGAVTLDNQYVRAKVVLIGGTGSGQEAIITDSTASTDTLTVTPEWLTNPDATTEYEILPAQVHATVRNGGYDNASVYVDVSGGTAGTQIGVNGTSTNPSLTLADARVIANANNISKFVFDRGVGLPVLDQSYIGWRFDIRSATAFNLNGQEVGFSIFDKTALFGTALGASGLITYEECGMFDVTTDRCNFLRCTFSGTTTLTAKGKYTALGCSTNSAGTLPVININGDGITPVFFNLVGYNGYMQFNTITAGDVIVVTGNCQLTLDASCTGGTLYIAGDTGLTDNSGGAVTIIDGDIANILDTVNTLPTATEILTTQMTESYAADSVAPTLSQALFITQQNLQDFVFAGTTQTVRKLDGSTTAATYTLDDATNPTSKTRTT